MKAVSLTSYETSIYEYTIWVKITMLVALKEDGTVWERRAGDTGPWKQIDTP
jgi:hypothetical protein